MKKQKIDATDKQIIKYLQDGRKSFSYVASKLNVTENTIRNRLNKLYDDKVFSLRGLVDPEYTPYIQIVIFGLKITGRGIARENCPVYVGDRQIGHTTSGTHCPYLGGAYAMAIVEKEPAPLGSTVEVEVRGKRIPAEVVKVQFYKR